MSIEYVFAGIVVAERKRAVRWYERLFGRPPDVLPNDREAMWQLADTASVYLVADPGRAGNSAVTVFVDDLDAEREVISRRGIDAGEIETAPGLFHKTTLVDPTGTSSRSGRTSPGSPEHGRPAQSSLCPRRGMACGREDRLAAGDRADSGLLGILAATASSAPQQDAHNMTSTGALENNPGAHAVA